MSEARQEELLLAAAAWYDAGACVLPAASDGTKRPAVSWQQYQDARPEWADIQNWFEDHDFDGIGLVTGHGGFEMFELEARAAEAGLLPELLAALPPELVNKLMTYMERTPSGGMHFVYRVTGEQEGSEQLAREPRPGEKPPFKVLIETRGKYAWTVLAPSGGRVHPSGAAWELLVGAPGVVPELTEEEHEALFEAARSLDAMPPPEPIEHRPPLSQTPAGQLSPGQDFERRADWMADILGPEGWTVWRRIGDKAMLTRPGKRFGASATLNYDGNDNLYVFTSSTDFPAFSSWTKFGAYAFLRHGGDFSAAARALAADGYGTPAEPTRILRVIQGGAGEPPRVGGPELAAAADPGAVVMDVEMSLTEHGNAVLIASQAEGSYLYVPERKQWLIWEGSRWHWLPDEGPVIMLARELFANWQPADTGAAKHKNRSLSARSIENSVRLSRSDPKLRVLMRELDADPWVVNTPDGALNLLTGEVSVPDPTALHTRMTGVAADFETPCPRWLAFLEETFEGDDALIAFVQRLAGYSATGKVTHHVLPFLHGPGANGKTVFLEVMLAILGDYAGTAPADFLLANGRDDSSAVAALSGQRFVVCSEVGPTARFHEQKVKLLTGGDRITARFLYQNEFTFSPTHHLWLAGNHQPRVSAGGESFWRRLRLIPFMHTVPVERRIQGLADQLVAEEGPAILAWLAKGARLQAGGLAEPEAVVVATAGYAEEEDTLGRFLSERVRVGGDPKVVRIDTKIVYAAYESWCQAEGLKPLPNMVFGRELKTHGIEQVKSNGRRFYARMMLLRPEDEPDSDEPEQFRF